MALEVKVTLAHLPKGEIIGIHGLPAIPNGGSIVLTKEDEEYFMAVNSGTPVKDLFSNINSITVTGTKETTNTTTPATTASKEGGES